MKKKFRQKLLKKINMLEKQRNLLNDTNTAVKCKLTVTSADCLMTLQHVMRTCVTYL